MYQGLIEKEKVHIDCEKGAQISILANKIATQWWSIIIKESKQTIHYMCCSFSCYYVHIMLLMWQKKLELCLMVVSVWAISIPMSKTACYNPCIYSTQIIYKYALKFNIILLNKFY